MAQLASTRKLVRKFECVRYDHANIVLDTQSFFDDIDTRSRKDLKEWLVISPDRVFAARTSGNVHLLAQNTISLFFPAK